MVITMSADEKKKFLEEITAHQNILHKICFIYSNNKDDKDDLYQEMVYQLWKSFRNFNGDSGFSTWMYRVALNTALTMVRKPKLFTAYDKSPDELFDLSPPSFEVDEELQILYKGIAKLKRLEKALIFLWLEEKTYEEMAAGLGISVKNVSVKLVRIKAKLQNIINEMV